MTLGPAIAALAVIDRVGSRSRSARALVTFGRVPLFYYLLLVVIHGLAGLAGLARGLPVAWLFSPAALATPPDGWSCVCRASTPPGPWCWPSSTCPAAGLPGRGATSQRLAVLPLIRLSSLIRWIRSSHRPLDILPLQLYYLIITIEHRATSIFSAHGPRSVVALTAGWVQSPLHSYSGWWFAPIS